MSMLLALSVSVYQNHENTRTVLSAGFQNPNVLSIEMSSAVIY